MRILTSLTYYRPYTSGLTIYAERLARALTKRGHTVNLLCMQHDRSLAAQEVLDGVRVIRAPYLLRLSKGFLSPRFLSLALREMKECDLVHLHLPQFEGAFLALLAVLKRKPLVITYHCDILMPPGLMNRLAGLAVRFMNRVSGAVADRVVAYTDDFAAHSPFLRRYARKREIIYPPVVLPEAAAADKEAVLERAKPGAAGPLVGMAARLAAEKGVEVLIDAAQILKRERPNFKILFAGPYLDVVGEQDYRDKILPRIKDLEISDHWVFLGTLTPSQMSAFYPLLSVLVVPSLNSTESFGLVQIEAMLNGIPAVASDLPGVRQPVKLSGMGKIVPIGDAAALAKAICDVTSAAHDYSGVRMELARQFSPETTAEKYEQIYQALLSKNSERA